MYIELTQVGGAKVLLNLDVASFIKPASTSGGETLIDFNEDRIYVMETYKEIKTLINDEWHIINADDE